MLSSFRKKHFTGLTKNTFLLTFASFFSDVSTEMLYPVLPVFLSQYISASGSIIGVIEGIATAIQNAIQGFSGFLSDKWRNRKHIALFGYCLSAVSKPLIGMASAWHTVLAARTSDRMGSGIRSAPRDALVAASAAEEHKGKAFGLESFGDNAGAFAGPVITLFLFFYFLVDIHLIFYLALIPGLLAVIMVLFVRDDSKNNFTGKRISYNVASFPTAYRKYLLVTVLFGLGNSSNFFLILVLTEKGLSLTATIAVYALYNLVAALFSYPAGHLSDKYGRKPLLMLAFIIFFLTYLGFAFTDTLWLYGLLFIFYGLFQGAFRAVGKSFATDFMPKELRASAVGWYSTAVGISALFASIVAGRLWDTVGHSSVFILGAASSFTGIIALKFLIKEKNEIVDQ